MTTSLVLTFIGHDRPGLVETISRTIAAFGGSWRDSRLAHLAGEFAGILLIDVVDANAAALSADLLGLEATGLRVTVERSAGAGPVPRFRALKLALVGHDRPGIVRDVTQVLTRLGVNIEEFTSGIESAAFAGDEMFRATAWLRVPDDVTGGDVQRALEGLAGEVMVDIVASEAERQG